MNISRIIRTNPDKSFPQLLEGKANTSAGFFCAHIGPSMNPTLTAQDLLEIKLYQNGRPRVGDIILFQPPGYDHFVVHRIVGCTANGIQTRGDNNSNIDPEYLKHDDILGKVIGAQRGSSRRKIADGYTGKVLGKICHLRRLVLHHAVKLFGPAYRSLSSSGFLHWLIPYRLTPQVATFHNGTNASHKLLLGERVIGSYDDTLHKWQIRRPYRLLVAESSLPKPR